MTPPTKKPEPPTAKIEPSQPAEATPQEILSDAKLNDAVFSQLPGSHVVDIREGRKSK